MPDTEPPLIEDSASPCVFFDGLTRVEARSGVMRMIAYVNKIDERTGAPVRVQVATLLRPVEATQEIRAAIKGAACEPYFLEFVH